MAHYTKEELELYRHHKTSMLGRIACAAHLKECPGCAKLLEELKKDDAFIKDLRHSIEVFQKLAQR